jgi:hypothetical protein
MKNTRFLRAIVFLSVASLLVLASCKKKDDGEPEPDAAAVEKVKAAEADGGQTGTDNREVQEENDVAVNEINQIISESKRLSGRNSVQITSVGGPCGLDVDSVKIKQDTILLKYNGVTCNNRTRTGVIRLSWAPGTKWKVAGATVKVDYLNYKVVRASDQRFFVLNGTQNVKNESGGTWLDLLLGQTLVTSVSGTNLQVTFTDGKSAVYNVNRRASYSVPNGVLTAKLEGIGSNGSTGSLENFGTTRNGESFTSQVTTPIIWNATCGGAVIQGGVTITNTSKNYSVSFMYGVDSNGNAQVVGANQCPFGWKFTWPGLSGTNTKVIPYK